MEEKEMMVLTMVCLGMLGLGLLLFGDDIE